MVGTYFGAHTDSFRLAYPATNFLFSSSFFWFLNYFFLPPHDHKQITRSFSEQLSNNDHSIHSQQSL